MSLPGLLPSTEFKKNYHFYWQLQGLENFIQTVTRSALTGKLDPAPLAFNAYAITNMLYVSQLAKEISLPDDELETETVDVGLVKFAVPTSVKMNDIEVTYLEDSANTVYNFHKMWQNCVVNKDKGFALGSIYSYTMEGWYISQDNSNSELQALINNGTGLDNLRNAVRKGMGSIGSHVYNPITDSGITELSKVRGVQIYPKIFPTRISRGSMTKDGDTISTVKVSYVRVPKLIDAMQTFRRTKADTRFRAKE